MLKNLLFITLFIFLGACSNRSMRHANLDADQHMAMAKAHQDTAACLKDTTKTKEDCQKIMITTMSSIKGKGCNSDCNTPCSKGGCKLKKEDCKGSCPSESDKN